MASPHPSHPCPLCGAPTILGGARYPASVCAECRGRIDWEHGRRVVPASSGPAIALLAHDDDGTLCEPVTLTKRVRIDGHPALATEAHFGGLAVEALSPPRLELVRGDITREHVDAVVNAANTAMRGGGGVDGAIHRAGGPAVLSACIARFPRGLATGDAGATTGGDLPAHTIIHTVGPNYRRGQRERGLLVSCYRRSLEVADELGVRTLAVPLISAGVYGWPLQDAADVAVETLGRADTLVERVRIVAFDDDAHDAVARALARVASA